MDRLDHDITEALARSREPGRMWAMLGSVEGMIKRPPGWWESWPALWCFTVAILVLAGVMLAKC